MMFVLQDADDLETSHWQSPQRPHRVRDGELFIATIGFIETEKTKENAIWNMQEYH